MYFLLVKDALTGTESCEILEKLFERLTESEQETDIVELTAEDTYEECISFFLEHRADAVITFDMAGLRTLNGEGESVFNSMYCKVVHVLTKEPWHYPDELLKRMNFQTILVTADKREKEYIERHYENVLQVQVMEKLADLRFFSESGSAEEIKAELNALPEVFRQMAMEIMKRWNRNSILCEEIDWELQRRKIAAAEDERVELCVLLKDIPKYFRIKEGKKMSEPEKAQTLEEVTTSIISLIREGYV